MTAKKFNFVSPGVFVGETDNSRIPRDPGGTGPVVIGRSLKGPSMRPVMINSKEEFVRMFGEPVASGLSRDVWRGNTPSAPTYGAYAAMSWLSNQSPVTFVRTLGVNNDYADAGSATLAGWSLVNSPTGVVPHDSQANPPESPNGGAWALIVAKADVSQPNSGDPVELTPTGDAYMAGVFYLESGILSLEGRDLQNAAGSTAETWDSNTGTVNWVGINAANCSFKLKVYDSGANPISTRSVNMNPNSTNYIRKRANTDPTKVNPVINTPSDTDTYWLGETFDQFLENIPDSTLDFLGTYSTQHLGETLVVSLVPLKGNKFDGDDFRMEATAGGTPWIVSQHLGEDSEFVADDAKGGEFPVEKLFRAHTLHSGSWESSHLKVSITDIEPPKTRYQDYGSFTLEIRRAEDNDNNKIVVEKFTGLTLDPTSSDYIAARIGDMYSVWSEDEKRYKVYGDYANQSGYIRVEVANSVKNGSLDPSLLPFGFYHPTVYKKDTPASSTVFESTINKTTLPIASPEFSMRESSETGSPSDPTRVYWGLNTSKALNYNNFDASYVDLVRPKASGLGYASAESGLTSAATTEIPFIVSLDDLVKDSSANSWTWETGSKVSGVSYTSLNGWETLLTQKQNSFTVPLVGGFDGFDVREREPFRNTLMDGTNEYTHTAYASIKRAVDCVSDPEVVTGDILTAPGVTNAGLTSYIAETAKRRGDMLAIIDLEGIYSPSWEGYSETMPDLDNIKANLREREFNNSYAATFLPSMQVRDDITGQLFWAPPSMIGLGVIGYSQSVSQPWIAPAGYNRGLLINRRIGYSVTNGRMRLSRDERDEIYPIGINAIYYSNDNDGWVLLGQKTLQATPSALDRINVRRLLIYLKREFSRIAKNILFDPNIDLTWNRFKVPAEGILADVTSKFGLSDSKIILDKTTTTDDLIDRNAVYAKVYLKPTKAIEYIGIDFNITNSGASFDD